MKLQTPLKLKIKIRGMYIAKWLKNVSEPVNYIPIRYLNAYIMLTIYLSRVIFYLLDVYDFENKIEFFSLSVISD